MRVIFLDIDGVLWTQLPLDAAADTFSADSVDQLNRILRAHPDVRIVISSAWRHMHPLGWLQDHFESQGIDPEKIVGITPYMSDMTSVRGNEITRWLGLHPDVTDFVIVDDDSDMGYLMDRLFQTKFQTGLTAEIADRIIEHFGNSHG